MTTRLTDPIARQRCIETANQMIGIIHEICQIADNLPDIEDDADDLMNRQQGLMTDLLDAETTEDIDACYARIETLRQLLVKMIEKIS